MTIIKETFQLEYEVRPGDWRPMYGDVRKGGKDIVVNTLELARKERTKAISRHKPYGRDYTYRIVKKTLEVVE
jgi:hypothetical protein